MQGQKKIGFLEFADVSGGVNSVENPVRIGQNQIQPTSIGCILKKSGIVKYPGAVGLSATDTFSDYLRMLKIYMTYAGTEYMVALSGSHLYFVNTTTGALTDKYTMGAAAGNYGSACESYNKMFVCNGAAVVKIEGTSVFPVGIAPPTAVTAAASAGAGLPDGDYHIIAGYARRASSADVLYSTGYTVGTVTLGGGNNRINVTSFPNSSDAQVGSKILWIKSTTAGEVIHYYFYGTNDNTTTTFIVSGTGAKNLSNIYETYALNNYVPPATSAFIYSFANRLWTIAAGVIYYSAKAYNEYDIEKFPAENFIVTPYNVDGIFSVGTNLYFNSSSGILVLENADPTSVLYLVEPRWHFQYMNTVDRWNNGVVGLTNDGVRFFDGQSFSNYDTAYHIKDKIAQGIASHSNFLPCGFVYRRAIRNEYHLLWQDDTVSSTVNNTHAILNLDTVMYAGGDQFNFAWEFQSVSGNYAAVSRVDNSLYIGQTHASAPKIYKETIGADQLNYLYLPDGSILSAAQSFPMMISSRFFMPAMNALCWFDKYRVLLANNAPVLLRFILPDQTQDGGGISPYLTIPAPFAGVARFDASRYDMSYYPINAAFVYVNKFLENFSGREIQVEISQNENDPNLEIMSTQLQYTFETGNFI